MESQERRNSGATSSNRDSETPWVATPTHTSSSFWMSRDFKLALPKESSRLIRCDLASESFLLSTLRCDRKLRKLVRHFQSSCTLFQAQGRVGAGRGTLSQRESPASGGGCLLYAPQEVRLLHRVRPPGPPRPLSPPPPPATPPHRRVASRRSPDSARRTRPRPRRPASLALAGCSAAPPAGEPVRGRTGAVRRLGCLLRLAPRRGCRDAVRPHG